MAFSIICAYNNKKLLEENLLEGLKRQDVSYDLILIDNTRNSYPSAAKAFNEAVRKARGEFLLFVHQDVQFISEHWLAEVEEALLKLPDLGAAGVAGRGPQGLVVENLIPHIPPMPPDSPPTQVQTLDGCLIVIPRKLFEALPFDEETIAGWYLYATDYCLDSIRFGRANYVFHQKTRHLSHGPPIGGPYLETLRKILKKHRPFVRVIYTTTGIWLTSGLSLQIALKKLRKNTLILFKRRKNA